MSVALGVYLPVALVSAAWIFWAEGVDELVVRSLGTSPLWDAGLGLVVGLFFVGLSRLASRTGRWRRLEDTLSEHLGPLRPVTCIVLAATSSVGEELAFRAALQPTVGLLAATLLFALAHVPFHRDLALWPLFAFVVGGAFGLLFEGTGAALAPTVAHFTVNALNLWWLAGRSS